MSIERKGRRALRPRARILRTFGDELISSETVAVIELVKNAYDADATLVAVRFTAPLVVGKGAIEVQDDGHGMSLETIQRAWMEPATAYRKRTTRSPRFNRRVLGEKGIGRFASSRLANHLEVITRVADDPDESHVKFDWRSFDAEEKYLDEIEAAWWSQAADPAQFNDDRAQGTTLQMSELRTTWEEADIRELRLGLSRLISPFASSLVDKSDPGFEIELTVPEPFAALSGKIDPPEALAHPLYRLNGTIEQSGRYLFEIDVGGLSEPELVEGTAHVGREHRSPRCGPIDLELRVWDRDAASLESFVRAHGITVRELRRDLDAVSGVSVYRDGFRVFPYGELGNDWLALDSRRVNNPTLRLSTNQVVGYVSISADANPDLRDQTNREGFIANQAYDDLQDLVVQALSEVENRRFRQRREGKETTRGGIFADLSMNPLTEYVRARYPDDSALMRILGDTESDLTRGVVEAQEVLGHYRQLATLGTLVDIVLHDGRAPLAKIANQARLGLRDVERNPGNEVITHLGDRLSGIRTQSDALGAVFRRLEPFGGRRRGRPTRRPLEDIISESFAVFDQEIDRLGVRVSISDTHTEVGVDAAELQEVFVNLVQNSLYWLRGTHQAQRAIDVGVRRVDSTVEVFFADSGPGVDPDQTAHIFDAYFSTKPKGIGLGLAISREIVRDFYDGELEVVEPGELGGATFRVVLRRRT